VAQPVAIVLKGYPRLSETFIAQEIRGLEALGLDLRIVSLRHPTDDGMHPIHREIAAPVLYLPEYLWHEPLRVLRGIAASRRLAGFGAAFGAFLRDLARDPTPNRVRRFGQASVLAAELAPDVARLHAHFIHTPASVARYAAQMRGLAWSVSAHAKDIWTIRDWEKREKLADCDWAVTCSEAARGELARLAPPGEDKVALVYHGIDLARFTPPPGERPPRDGRDAGDPVTILTVGRTVEKKGHDVLIDALALLPRDVAWRLQHVGGGPLSPKLKRRAARAGIADRISWLGAMTQDELLVRYRAADLFVLACRVARDGDRDGLPNVLMEAASQGLACVATRVSGVPELIEDATTGLLVAPEDPAALARAIATLIAAPERRRALGRAAERRVRERFRAEDGIDAIAQRFGIATAPPRAARVR
jgi:glycosyltransferase involved in cell wall biosynthesis